MVTRLQHNRVKGFKVEFSKKNVTSFGGLVLGERLAKRLSLWRHLGRELPARSNGYNWLTVIKTGIIGLLSGSRGTYATQDIRNDKALLDMLGVKGAPEEASFWRQLWDLGGGDLNDCLTRVHRRWVRIIGERVRRQDVMVDGFVPVFADGSLLEGSKRREGSKYMKGKGDGLLWGAVFVGSLLCAQRVAGEGEGEQNVVRGMLPEVVDDVLEPLGFKPKTLLLADSLHGDGPTLDLVEGLELNYIIGANKLDQTPAVLSSQPEEVWEDTGHDTDRNWAESGVCCCWLECEGWSRKRLLVGRRVRKDGELFFEYSGVVTSLCESDVAHLTKKGISFSRVVWSLYGRKAGMEDYFKDLLVDLGMHHPPCQQHRRNQGFYTLGALAYVLGHAVELLGREKSNSKTSRGKKTRRKKTTRMRLWRLRRMLFTLPGKVSTHARQLKVVLMGVSEPVKQIFDQYWHNILRC